MKYDSDLFYTCSLIEYIGRLRHLKRAAVVNCLGIDEIKRIYKYADVFHCEMIESVADQFILRCDIREGKFDNVAMCRYEVPDYWTIGEVYERLIEDVYEEDILKTLQNVYNSFVSDAISQYNSDFFYQPRDYIAECYRESRII